MTSAKQARPPKGAGRAPERRRRHETDREPEAGPQGVSIEGSQVQVGGDIAGRDIINVLVNLPAPVMYGAIALGLLVLVATFGPGVVTRFQGPPPMGAFFNVAVAEFGQIDERGHSQPSQAGAALSESIFNRINDELEPYRRRNFVEVRGEGVGRIGGTEADWDRTAEQVLNRHNAHVLIYGNFETRGGQPQFVPKFYLSPKQRELRVASELLGPSRLGTSVPGSSVGPSDALDARARALALFAIGLVYLTDQQPDQAVQFFSQAGQVSPWREAEGKEVFYLFLGTAFVARNQAGDLDEARQAYSRAVALNREYGRAYIGLGNVSYLSFQHSDQTSNAMLDEAEASYRSAIAASDKPRAAHVDAKAHLSLGNLYLVRAQGGEPAMFGRAEQEYSEVVAEYEAGNDELKSLAAWAYFGLGLRQELGQGDPSVAADYYRRSLARADDDTTLRTWTEPRLKALDATASSRSVIFEHI